VLHPGDHDGDLIEMPCVAGAGQPATDLIGERLAELPGAPSTCRPQIAKGGLLSALCGRRDTGDLRPKLEGPGPCGSLVAGGEVIAAEREEVVDLVMRREQPLRLTGGFEPLHLPFASPHRLVRILGSVVQALVSAVLGAGHQFFLRRGLARQLIGDQHPRRLALLPQQLAQQALGRLLVASAPHQHVEHDAILVDRPPQPVRRIWLAKAWPNLSAHCRPSICFAARPWLTVMPRAASISSTMRRLSGQRK
jgi:hypothetical protein